jgi:hypothetical protein
MDPTDAVDGDSFGAMEATKLGERRSEGAPAVFDPMETRGR